MATQLPIDVVPNRTPLCFRWQFRASSILGASLQQMEGNLPPSVEGAVANLIEYAKELQADNKRLYEEIERLKKPKGK